MFEWKPKLGFSLRQEGAHLLVQTRMKMHNEEWEDYFRRQYRGFQPLLAESLPMAA